VSPRAQLVFITLGKTLAFVKKYCVKNQKCSEKEQSNSVRCIFLVTKISVDVDSKQLVKLLFPDIYTAYRRCRPNNSPNYHLVTEVLNCNAS